MIVVKLNGQSYNLFDDINVSTSIDNIVGTFSFKTTLKERAVFKKGDLIEIYIDNKLRLKGYIEKTSGSITNDSADIIYSGRDLLGDLIDSSVPDSMKVSEESVSLPTLCQRVIDSLRIRSKVVNLAGNIDPFTSKEIESVGFGGKAGGFLQSFARKRGVFLTTFGDGDLVIFSPPSEIFYPEKLTVDSMLKRNFDFDDSQRFNVVRVGSQDNPSATDDAEVDGVDRTKAGVDPDIRPSRYLEIQAEETMNDVELLRRSNEEINIRRARGFDFNCDVPTHKYEIGKLIQVDDKLSGTSGTFLIRSITYNQTLNGGNISNLVLAFPESYSAQGKRVSKRKSKMGDNIVKKDVPTVFDLLNDPTGISISEVFQ